MSLPGNFSIDEAKSVGKKFRAKCVRNDEYEDKLTIGKEYEIVIEDRILPMSPLCSFRGDHGKNVGSHLSRFEKVEEIV